MNRGVVHIERLILRGLPEKTARSMPEALKNELARQFGDPAILARLTASRVEGQLSLGKITLGAESLATVGTSVAQGISREIVENQERRK